MIQEVKLLGCHAQFALAGTTQTTPTPSGSGVVSKSFLPADAAVDSEAKSLWMDLGIISEVGEGVKAGATIKVFRPSPGSLVLDEVKESKYERTLKLKIEECSNVMWSILRRSLTTTTPRTGDIGDHTTLSSGTIRGWLKVQSYDQDTNALIIQEKTWVAIQINNPVTYGNDKNVMFDCDVTQLYSALNEATGS
jgi:hypothetical protein